ncbi:hypothetical protein ACINWC136_1398 [Acinetobacter pittii]|nr:hypothetical protein ACINWC136_1398 [Acinetobacter pittii]
MFYSEPPLPRASLVIWIVGIGLVIFFIWAWVFKLEEVSTVQVKSFHHLKNRSSSL